MKGKGSKMLNVLNFIALNYQTLLAAAIMILTGIITISLVIPGDQPEKALQGVVDFLSKFSKK